MSASISGGFPMRSTSRPTTTQAQEQKKNGTTAKGGRRRPSVTSGLSLSSPDVPQLHSMPSRIESPETHPPTATVQQPHHHHHHMSLHPLTPLNAPGTTSSSHSSSSSSGGGGQPNSTGGAYSTLSGPGPSASSLSLTSIDSASTSYTTATGVSRASSTRSTSSVQAVPMRKPQRTPAVPRIVTRGINALSAYGVGMTSAGAGGATAPLSPTWEKGRNVVGSSPADFPSMTTTSAASPPPREDENHATLPPAASGGRPSVLQRSSWRRRVGSNSGPSGAGSSSSSTSAAAVVSNGHPSPVPEDGSRPSSPVMVGSGDLAPLEPWRVLERPGDETGSPIGSRSRSTRRASPPQPPDSPTNQRAGGDIAGGWGRPRYDRAELTQRADGSPRMQSQQRDNDSSYPAPLDSSSLSPARVVGSVGGARGGRGRPHGFGHERDPSYASHASTQSAASTATPTSPTMPRSADRDRAGDRMRAPPAEHHQAHGQDPSMGMMPNVMGVVGNRRSTEDFEFGDVLGEGSYSTVSGLLFSWSPSQDCVNKD